MHSTQLLQQHRATTSLAAPPGARSSCWHRSSMMKGAAAAAAKGSLLPRSASPAAAAAAAAPRSRRVATAAMRGSSSGEKWWEKETPNMRNVASVQELVDELADAGDSLVVVDFYAPWCGACRALYPKLLKLMAQFPDVVFIKVNFDENKEVCKALGVKVLPYFQVYHGAEGRVAAFSCTNSKFDRMREAFENYHTPICSLESNPGLPEFPDIIPHPSELTRVAGVALPAAQARLAAEQQQQQRQAQEQRQPAGVA